MASGRPWKSAWGAACRIMRRADEEPPMTCEETVARRSDYLEMTPGEEVIADLERHRRDCAPCVAYPNTFRATRCVTVEVARMEMPEEVKERLRSVLLARLR